MIARLSAGHFGRHVTLVACVVSVLSFSGCASLPDTSTPEAIGTIAREPSSVSLPQPAPGREPDLLLRDFVKASTDPTNRHLAARQFLTAQLSAKWDDAASATIVDKVDVLPESRTNDRATYVLRANRVGQLQTGGQYQAEEGSFETKIGLSKVDGEWRINELPAGVILDRPQFFSSYQRESLYWLNPEGTTTIPDPRWISAGQDQLAAQLIGLLVDGPKETLAPAVRNQFAGKVSVRGPITKADGRTESVGIGLGGIKVDFQGIAAMEPGERQMLAAQVIWTLASAEISGPYVLLADGKPLDDQRANGWTTADVAEFNPLANTTTNIGLHAVRDGALVSVNDKGVTPTPGTFGVANNVRSVALSRDGTLVAAVVGTGRPPPDPANTLMVGTYDGGAFPVAEGNEITRPSWAADDGAAWAVVDGTKVIRAVRDTATNQVSVVDVDASAIVALGQRITELRLARGGVRAALIVDGKVYVAVIVPTPSGTFALTSPRPIAIGLGSPAVSLDWSTGENIVIARTNADTPVVIAPVDGSNFVGLPSRNLTAPVTAVDASATTEYVADARAVFQFNNNDPEADRYWREVPGLTGMKAIPVLPG